MLISRRTLAGARETSENEIRVSFVRRISGHLRCPDLKFDPILDVQVFNPVLLGPTRRPRLPTFRFSAISTLIVESERITDSLEGFAGPLPRDGHQ